MQPFDWIQKQLSSEAEDGLDTQGNPAPVARQQGTSEDSKDSTSEGTFLLEPPFWD